MKEVAGRLADVLPPECIDTWTSPDGAEIACASPHELAHWRAVVGLAGHELWRVLPVGYGSKLAWCNPADRVDLALCTRRWSGVTHYEPGDGTLTARSGSTMSELAAAVHEGGHHLTPDVPGAAQSSLGGVLAAGQSGFDRLRFGPARNNVLGTRVLLADGSVTKSGGALVKNVTGYDLHRLYCGSHGTLCVIIEASLRLFPLPEERCVASARFADRNAALIAAREIVALPVRLVGVCIHDHERRDGAPPWELVAVLAGRADVVREERERIGSLAHQLELHTGAAADERADAARERELEDGVWADLWLGARPTRLAGVLATVDEVARELGLEARMLVHPGVASASIRLQGGNGEPATEAWLALHAKLSATRAQLRWRNAPRALHGRVDALGEPPAGLPLMRRLKDALDPAGLFAAGRFHDGI